MHADTDGQKRETGVSDNSVARFFFGGGVPVDDFQMGRVVPVTNMATLYEFVIKETWF